MRPRALPLVNVTLAVCLAACGGEGSDSADDADVSGITYDVVEELRIDGYEHTLVPIDTTFRVTVRDDGLIAIGQRQTNEVRFFSDTGEPLGSVGRQGEGPGEFMQLWRMGWIADTLYAYDRGLRRFTLISPELEYVRYIYVPAEAHPGPEMEGKLPLFNAVYGAQLYADGSVYGQFGSARDPVKTEAYDPEMNTYGRVAEDGTILSYFQWTEGSADPIEITIGDQTGFLNPYVLQSPERPIMRLDDTGERMAYVRVAMEGPDAGTFEVEMEDIFSGVLYERRYPFDPEPITQEVRDSILEAYLEGAPPEFVQPLRRGAYFPPLMPPIHGLVGGKDDTFWIRMADTPMGRTYRIHDSEGEPVGTVTIPSNETIAVADLSQNRIWVIQKDDYDVESVVRYRLVPAQTTS